MDVLVCPSCRGAVELRTDDDREVIACTVCGLRYPVRDGLPVMLVEEAVGP
jgi:uncharacterized protein YbaR (Trm112 family)